MATAVGAFLVVGLGFVLTFFFAGQFAGGGTEGTSVLSNVSVAAGFGLAFVVSPLLAALVGREIGSDGGDGAVFDAAVGCAVGFVVMVFVALLVAGSLGSATGGSAGGLVSAGSLLGFAVGVGFTGAGGAIASNGTGPLPASVEEQPLGRAAVTGVTTFLVFGAGYVVSVVLADFLSSDAPGIGIQLGIGSTVAVVVAFALLLAPVLALAVGRHAVDEDAAAASGAAAGGVAAAAGVLALLAVVSVAMLLVQDGGSDLPLGPMLGFAVGIALTGAGAGYVTARD